MASTGQAGPSDPLALLLSLPLSHHSFLDLLRRVRASLLLSKSLSRLVGRLNACLLGSAGTVSAADKAIGWRAVEILVEKDESLVVDHGKGWLDVAMAATTAANLPVASVLPAVELLERLILVSSRYPSFERESVQPLMGKLVVSLGRLLDRAASEGDLNSLIHLLETTKAILAETPAPFRASSPALKTLLRAITLNLPLPASAPSSSTLHSLNAPTEVKMAAADLLAHLYMTAGKSQASSVWSSDMKEALAGLSYAVDGFVQDAYVEETRSYASQPSGVPVLPQDPAQRVTMALDLIDGYTEIIVALLNVSTSRPVQIPLSNLVQIALRCLDLTLESPIASHISPLHQAFLTGSLPRLWTAGLQICGSTMAACGDHILPHLSNILDHSIFLLEQTPASMTSIILQLLSFHVLFLQLYPPALVPIEYVTRLLKYCLARSGALLEKRDVPVAMVNGSGGKRGKKRARGAEDGLIGSLEGRAARPISVGDVEMMLACLKFVPALHAAPLLPASLLTLSIRLHLSLSLRLSSLAPSSFAQSANLASLTDAVAGVLEEAVLMTEKQSGTSKGWKTVILSLMPSRGERLSVLLHPAVPPMIRAQPPLTSLHYFSPESEEEKKLRLEMGFGQLADVVNSGDLAMDDEPAIGQSGYVPTLQPQATTLQIYNATPATEPLAPTPRDAPILNPPNSLAVETARVVTLPSSTVLPANGTVPVPNPEGMDVDAPASTTGPSSKPSMLESVPITSHGGGSKLSAQTLTATTLGKRPAIAQDDDDDEPIPELDSGSSIGFASDDEYDE